MENSYPQKDKDLELANLNATIANLGVNLVILSHIQEQITLQKQSMVDTSKFHQELLQTLDRIIKNQ